MVKNTRSPVKRCLWIVFFLVLIAAIVAGVMFRQQIKDHFSAAAFDPSPRVADVVSGLRLTEAGERVLLATHPTIDGSQHFNEQCAEVDHSEQGHVLGCFTRDRIHLFDVTDERVDGIVEVTAAHELLHATFARLSDGDRAVVGAKLRQEYELLATSDPELKERMSVYEHLSDAAFANELHSVLGTEIRDLPEWLEKHYAQWFTDRNAIVDSFAAYHSVFVDLQQQAEDIQAEMKALRSDVEQRKLDYGAAVDQFNADAASFTARNEQFDFSDNPDEFERIRSDLEWRRGDLEATLTALQADIDRYNALRDQLAALSEVSTQLDQQLNSDLAPVTTRPTA